MTTRKAPRPPFDNAPKGHCRMCGEPILTKDGKPHGGRSWCEDHQIESRIRQHSTIARAAVFLRDRGICRDCGTDCTSYVTIGNGRDFPYRVQINRERALDWCESLIWKKSEDGKKTLRPQNPKNLQSARAIDLGEWEADHVYPLWLVDRDEPDAWKHWTLDNLVTRCPSCHRAKSDKEAGQRAKIKRLNGTVKKKRRGRKLESANRWPPKGSRKIPSRRAT